MATRILTEDEFDGFDCYADGWEEIDRTITDQRRWSVTYRAILRSPEGVLYETFVERGATEMQDSSYDRKAYEVVAVEKVVTQYERVM